MMGFNPRIGLVLLAFVIYAVTNFQCTIQGHPVGQVYPQSVEGEMRQIPQWHCLRYRRIDMIKRCRTYRIIKKHK